MAHVYFRMSHFCISRPMSSILIYILILFALLVILPLLFYFIIKVRAPKPSTNLNFKGLKPRKISDKHTSLEGAYLKGIAPGLWIQYVEGPAYDRGMISGLLLKDLVHQQEEAFVNRMKELMPIPFFRGLTKYGIAFFNRNLKNQIPAEFLEELAGIAQSSSKDFDYIAPAFQRKLNYHAAHDIGHALQNMNVACTSFALKNERTITGELLIGRNFDFYSGDDFAKDKIVQFVKPEKGIPFAHVTWAGMVGVVSGMNLAGISVSLNAAKSKVPKRSGTPVSIVAREILQFASTLEEAEAILKKRRTFVAETFMVGSGAENTAVVFEKDQKKLAKVEMEKNQLICTNHFQSPSLGNSALNVKHLSNSPSLPRFNKVKQLLSKVMPYSIRDVIAVLRDQKSIEGIEVGMGNELVVNQLICHHSIIFSPREKQFWVSEGPYQLGKFHCFDLNHIFNNAVNPHTNFRLKSLEIEADSFLDSAAFANYRKFWEQKQIIESAIANKDKTAFNLETLRTFSTYNPSYFLTWWIAGKGFALLGHTKKAIESLEKSLKLSIASTEEKEEIANLLNKLKSQKQNID